MENNNSFNIRSILEKEKLNGKNFLDWQRNLQIVLMQEEKEYVLEEAMPEVQATGSLRQPSIVGLMPTRM